MQEAILLYFAHAPSPLMYTATPTNFDKRTFQIKGEWYDLKKYVKEPELYFCSMCPSSFSQNTLITIKKGNKKQSRYLFCIKRLEDLRRFEQTRNAGADVCPSSLYSYKRFCAQTDIKHGMNSGYYGCSSLCSVLRADVV